MNNDERQERDNNQKRVSQHSLYVMKEDERKKG